ncbi:hypothetical protein OVA29_11155 [Exiguobacterium sp. SL14]|nr:hypothetical protein [Exiguobacterium sp. SL14]MCY1691170.1 hypothetical protein [Exiguobacterium sp. SL14]
MKRLSGRSDQAVWSVKTSTDHFIVKTVMDSASLRYEQEANLLIPEQHGIAHALPLATGRTATIAYGIYPYLSGRTVRSVLQETAGISDRTRSGDGESIETHP